MVLIAPADVEAVAMRIIADTYPAYDPVFQDELWAEAKATASAAIAALIERGWVKQEKSNV